MTTWLEKPNFLSALILVGVILIAGGYGVITYTQRPEMESFNIDETYQFDFDFDRPQAVKLPKDLKEISGMTSWKSPEEVLTVQDEDGELFVVNTKSGKVVFSFKFSKDRDYEGIARLNDSIYVLETDGDIHTFLYDPEMDEFESKKLETSFSYRNDTEGICYDPVTGNLLIVPKEQELNPTEADQNRRGIYSYDLSTRTLSPQPTYYIDQLEVGDAVYGKASRYTLKPSGIAIDPLTNDIFVVSSVGNIMVVIDRESNLKHIELLEQGTFRQPEGITFNEAGDLFISSEGRGGDGIIATFPRQNKSNDEKDSNQ